MDWYSCPKTDLNINFNIFIIAILLTTEKKNQINCNLLVQNSILRKYFKVQNYRTAKISKKKNLFFHKLKKLIDDLYISQNYTTLEDYQKQPFCSKCFSHWTKNNSTSSRSKVRQQLPHSLTISRLGFSHSAKSFQVWKALITTRT